MLRRHQPFLATSERGGRLHLEKADYKRSFRQEGEPQFDCGVPSVLAGPDE